MVAGAPELEVDMGAGFGSSGMMDAAGPVVDCIDLAALCMERRLALLASAWNGWGRRTRESGSSWKGK